MKRFGIAILCVVLCLCALLPTAALAATVTDSRYEEMSVTLSTDKDTYAAGEPIAITLDCEKRRDNTHIVYGVRAAITLPSPLVARSGSLQGGLDVLDFYDPFRLIDVVAGLPAAPPATGDNGMPFLWLGLGLAAIAALLLCGRRGARKRIALLLLCALLTGAVCTPATARAANRPLFSCSLSVTVTVDGERKTITATVSCMGSGLARTGLIENWTEETKAITLSPVGSNSPDGPFTAATSPHGNAWNKGDTIGMYMLDNNAAEFSNYEFYSLNAARSVYFAPAGYDILFPVDGSRRDFIAYAPHKAGVVNGIYPINVANQADLAALDLLRSAKVTDRDKNSSSVDFCFYHKMARLQVELRAAAPLTASSLTNAKVEIHAMPTLATYDLLTEGAAVTPRIDPSSWGTIRLPVTGATADGILIPAPTTGAQLSIILTNGNFYSLDLTVNGVTAFTAGTLTKLTLTLLEN